MEKKNIHFVGIGGIGISALAQYYLKKGSQISGSDLVSSETIDYLESMGAKITIGKHKKENIPHNIDLIIYSPAIQKSNPEIKKNKKIKIQSYPEALGEITKNYFTVAVSGTHGKSTTATILGLLLKKAKLDPTIIVGTKVKEFNNSNCRVGKSKYLIIEADEHFASFLNYRPNIIILTNIEKDHLDYYKNLNNILKTFKQYIKRLPEKGFLVLNGEDKNISKIKKFALKLDIKIKEFNLKQKEAKKIEKTLKIPGRHNVYNALAALKVARILKISDDISYKSFSEYRGSWRRFETSKIKIRKKTTTLISDYGHHPTEIRATLQAAREKYLNKRIWCIFQPHQYQRTFYLFNDFVESFNEADEIIITKIYTVKGREDKDIVKKVNAKKLVKAIEKKGKNVYFIEDFTNVPGFLKNKINPGDVVIVMGAGDIYKLCKIF